MNKPTRKDKQTKTTTQKVYATNTSNSCIFDVELDDLYQQDKEDSWLYATQQGYQGGYQDSYQHLF